MGDGLLDALVIAAVAVLIGAVMWALLAYTRRLDGNIDPEPVCGADGPYGLKCDREPHTEPLHKSQGIEWWPS